MKNFLLNTLNGLLTLCEWFNYLISALAVMAFVGLMAYSIYDFGECMISGEEVCLGKE